MEQQQQFRRKRDGVVQVLDGSEIRALVENRDAFARFVDDRFRKLDGDGDGRLSVKELQPAVADIGAAIGLPARGSSRQADHIYAEVRFRNFALFLFLATRARVGMCANRAW
jgi:hypothetical protein